MATSQHRAPTSAALAAVILAAAIGCTPIVAAILASAPSAELAR